MKKIIIALLFPAICLATCRIHAQSFIVQDGKANAEIIHGVKPPRMVSLAGTELQIYIKKISGAELPIHTSPAAEYPVKIYLGRSEYTDQLGVTGGGLKYGAFRMVSGENYLVLLGDDFDFELPTGPVPFEPWPASIPAAVQEWEQLTGSPYDNPMRQTYKSYHKNFDIWEYEEGGSLYAVYELLRMLGSRWYMPGDLGEILPELSSVPLPSVDTTIHPDFAMRHLHWSSYRSASWDNLIWERRIGLNSCYELLGAGSMIHGMKNVMGRYEMKQAHPEYYALINGVRDTSASGKGHACFNAEGLVEETSHYIRSVMDHFGEPTVSIWPMDGYRACECELCKDKSPSELVWNFAGKVAAEVYKTHPDRLVTCGAYAQYREPPASIDTFSQNLAVIISNTMRPALDHPQKWAEYRDLIESWQERMAPGNIMRLENNRFHIWNGYEEPVAFPVIHPRAMAKDLKGLKGISQGDWNEASRANLASTRGIQVWKSPGIEHLTLYVQGRFFWDADQDIDTLLEEYYTLFYGPAREEMKTALEFAQENYSRTDESRGGGKCDPMNVSLPIKIQLLELLHTAHDSAGETVYGQRIQKIIDDLVPLESLRPEIREKATLTVIDRSSGDPLYRAEVRYGEAVHATDYLGRAVLDDIEEGQWVFTVDHNAYFPLTDSLMFSGDTSLVIPMTRRLATIRFEVMDSTGPIENVPVSLFNWKILTDGEGRVLYNNQPARRQYNYAVNPDGYGPVTDSFFLEIDTTVSVMLQPATMTNAYAVMEARVFPNPAIENLFIRTVADRVRASLLGPEGKIILEKMLDAGLNTLDVSGYPQGIYYLHLQTDGKNIYRKILIQ